MPAPTVPTPTRRSDRAPERADAAAPAGLPATALPGVTVVRLAADDAARALPREAPRDAQEKAWDRLLAVLIAAVPERRDLTLAAGDVAWFAGHGAAASLFRARLPRVGVVEFTEHAARQVAALAELRTDFVERLAARRSRLLPELLAEEWGLRFATAPLRWRLVNGVVHAVLSGDAYTPIDDIPLLRSLEPAFRARGLAPVRLVRDVVRTRVEFAGWAVPGTRYRVGVVLGNSEVGAASATLAPALVRRGGYATRLAGLNGERGVGSRHTISDPSTLVARMTDALPRLLAVAEGAVRAWEAMRATPLPDTRRADVRNALVDLFGARGAKEVIAAWMASAAPTPTNLYRVVAERVSGDGPWRHTDTDALLARLLGADPA